jgi:hypothetical protein
MLLRSAAGVGIDPACTATATLPCFQPKVQAVQLLCGQAHSPIDALFVSIVLHFARSPHQTHVCHDQGSLSGMGADKQKAGSPKRAKERSFVAERLQLYARSTSCALVDTRVRHRASSSQQLECQQLGFIYNSQQPHEQFSRRICVARTLDGPNLAGALSQV